MNFNDFQELGIITQVQAPKYARLTQGRDENGSGLITVYAVDVRDRYPVAQGTGYTERAARLEAIRQAINAGYAVL
jgi:hypothetical protein